LEKEKNQDEVIPLPLILALGGAGGPAVGGAPG